LYDDPKQAPQWEKYVVERLFLDPEAPLVTYHGYTLPTERTEEGRVVSFSSVLPQIDNADVISLAKEFVHAYFTYTSWGFYETQAHLQAVLAMTAPGSQLSAKLRRSLDSFSYVTPVTAEQRDLTAKIVYEPEPGAFIVPIIFQVQQEIYSVRRAFSGTITLLIRSYGDSYAVYGMVIENDP
jgi:hypothetical protein